MTEKDEERSFEDHFDELAGDAVPEAPLKCQSLMKLMKEKVMPHKKKKKKKSKPYGY